MDYGYYYVKSAIGYKLNLYITYVSFIYILYVTIIYSYLSVFLLCFTLFQWLYDLRINILIKNEGFFDLNITLFFFP